MLADEFHAAIEWFDKAKVLNECHWTVNEGQALAYAQLEDLESACRKMKIVLTVLRSLKEKDGSPDENIRAALVRNLKKLACWQEQLKANKSASFLYEEILDVDPYEH